MTTQEISDFIYRATKTAPEELVELGEKVVAYIKGVEARAEAAERSLDIIVCENLGEPPEDLDSEYGGTGAETHAAVASTRAIRQTAATWMRELARLQELRDVQLQASNDSLEERRTLRTFLARIESIVSISRWIPDDEDAWIRALLIRACTAARRVVRL